MCDFQKCSTFNIDNEYYTKKEMWKNISHLIPKDKIIYEACILNSNSKSIEYWKELGYNVVGNKEWDIFDEHDIEWDICITNPPFETIIKQNILKKLVEWDKPFIIVMNASNTFTSYFREIFKDKFKDLQTIIPKGKILFEKYNIENKTMEKAGRTGAPAFYCIYLCYKMNLKPEELWLI